MAGIDSSPLTTLYDGWAVLKMGRWKLLFYNLQRILYTTQNHSIHHQYWFLTIKAYTNVYQRTFPDPNQEGQEIRVGLTFRHFLLIEATETISKCQLDFAHQASIAICPCHYYLPLFHNSHEPWPYHLTGVSMFGECQTEKTDLLLPSLHSAYQTGDQGFFFTTSKLCLLHT